MMRPINAILMRNLIKLSRDKMRLFMTIFMSVLFLFVFSFVTKSSMANIPRPMDYLISGVIIMTVFQSAFTNSMHILEDISSGFMKEILVAPIARWQIAMGQVFSSAIISVAQGLIVMVLGLFLGFRPDPFHGLLMVAFMFLVGFTFSAIGLFLATVTRTSSRFQLLVTIVSFPLTFLSGAYIPTMMMPRFLLPIVLLNPLTHTTSVFRCISLQMLTSSSADQVRMGIAFTIGRITVTPLMSTMLVLVMGIGFLSLAVLKFRKADFSRVDIFKRHH